MIESADELPLAGFRQANEAEAAPLPVPDVKFLMRAVEAAQQVRDAAVQMETLLAHAPGDRATFEALFVKASRVLWDASMNFDAFHAVRECRGTA